MEGLMSKKPTETSSSINLNNDTQSTTELSSYDCEAAGGLDNFDPTQQARINHFINSLAVGVEDRVHSSDLLKDLTECPLEMQQEVVECIMERKKDIWKAPELFEFVEKFFQNRLQTLHFFPTLEKYLKHAHNSGLLILEALQQFEEESEVGCSKYVRTLEKLNDFKVAGDPFTEEFIDIVQSDCKQQILMSKELQLRKNKLVKKNMDTHFRRNVSSKIFAAIFPAVLIGSIVATAMAAPRVAAALSAAATCIALVGKWIDSLFKNYENALKGQDEVISSMQVGTCDAIMYLGNIQVLINKLKIDIEAVMQNVDLAIEKEAVKCAIEEIKKKAGVFTKNVKDLGVQADLCNREIRRAVEVLQRIIKPPNN